MNKGEKITDFTFLIDFTFSLMVNITNKIHFYWSTILIEGTVFIKDINLITINRIE